MALFARTPIVRTSLLLGSAALLLSGCASSPTPTASPTPTSAAWSYSGANGPARWGEVAAACTNTSAAHESPIDIVTADLVAGSAEHAVVLDYEPTAFELENNGHAIEAVPQSLTADSIVLDGERYDLQQFHFHVGSEHTVDGAESAAELHLVHQSRSGEVVVLGVLLSVGEENAELAQLLREVPTESTGEGEAVELTTPIDPAALLPQGSLSAQYDGSLTTPPCTEGVRWNVYLTGVTVSAEQLAALAAAYPDNHRPVQALHDRAVSAVPAA